MMKTGIAIAFSTLILCCDAARAFETFDWAVVGNKNNASDNTGFGAVAYTYQISKYEVTNTQYAEFLNATDPAGTNTFALYNANMSVIGVGGINFDPFNTNGSKYEVKSGHGNNPVTYVSFIDAMRFVNWLENGQPTDGSGTESGVYTISKGFDEKRALNATFYIPSENEWYKAAYHKNDGATNHYWQYPMQSDSRPYSDQPPGSDAPMQSNTGNFRENDYIDNGYDDGFAVLGYEIDDYTLDYLTDVGAYPSSVGPYGTFDQGGNVYEWNESIVASQYRGIRGGSWYTPNLNMDKNYRFIADVGAEGDAIGFRIARAVVPEPSSALLCLAGITLMGRRRC